jgi:hypothetical protein
MKTPVHILFVYILVHLTWIFLIGPKINKHYLWIYQNSDTYKMWKYLKFLDLKLWREGLKESLVPVKELPARPLTLRADGWTEAKVAREAMEWMIVDYLINFHYSLTPSCLCDQNMTWFGFLISYVTWRNHILGATWTDVIILCRFWNSFVRCHVAEDG